MFQISPGKRFACIRRGCFKLRPFQSPSFFRHGQIVGDPQMARAQENAALLYQRPTQTTLGTPDELPTRSKNLVSGC